MCRKFGGEVVHVGTLALQAKGISCFGLEVRQKLRVLVTYVAGPVKSTVDYIMVRQEDKAKIRNVKVITSEECVPKHKLLVMDMWFKATKRRRRKFEPRCMYGSLRRKRHVRSLDA